MISLPRSRRAAVFALTFVVAFCSIVYELIYSELLAVIFGGTVIRYSITIGLFLFSLGVGAFLFRYVDDHPSNFFRLEVYLALAGPLGLVFIIGVNSLPISAPPELETTIKNVLILLSHLPIVVVGLLSGLEIPFLTDLVDAEPDGSGHGTDFLGAIGSGSRTIARVFVGLLFQTSATNEASAHEESTHDESFSEVLGMDYLGSLVGTVTYALVLYPSLGVIATVFVLGLLNAVAALVFYLLYRQPSLAVDVTFGSVSTVLLAVCLISVAGYAGALAYNDTVSTELRNLYLEEKFEGEYGNRQMTVSITEHESTRYQDIVLYERNWTGKPGVFQPSPETCLRLDTAVQLCESWVDSYHSGLVDVPASLSGNLSDKRVLLVGGGDWIAVNYLRKHNTTVDQVDIDREFMGYTKQHPFFEQYHDDAYTYDRLHSHTADAYTYLRNTDQQYDLILLDLPGARSDDLLHLYSEEFYQQLRSHLRADGVVVTWAYSRRFAEHRKAYLNTVHAAGFESYMQYHAYEDRDNDSEAEQTEKYYIFSPASNPGLAIDAQANAYVSRYRDRYEDRMWESIPTYRNVQTNSIFHPNYDIIVDI